MVDAEAARASVVAIETGPTYNANHKYGCLPYLTYMNANNLVSQLYLATKGHNTIVRALPSMLPNNSAGCWASKSQTHVTYYRNEIEQNK